MSERKNPGLKNGRNTDFGDTKTFVRTSRTQIQSSFYRIHTKVGKDKKPGKIAYKKPGAFLADSKTVILVSLSQTLQKLQAFKDLHKIGMYFQTFATSPKEEQKRRADAH